MTRMAAQRGRGNGSVRLVVLLASLAAPGAAAAAAAPADEPAPLTVADLAAYRAALSAPKGAVEPPAAVGFRALFSHPEAYQGRRVQVQGRPARRFRQGPFGTFPPLEEFWIVSPAGDPFCLVFPAASDSRETGTKATATTTTTTGTRTRTRTGAGPSPTENPAGAAKQGTVRFTGTFLKLLEYQGGDGPRLAPLIVGPDPPRPLGSAAAPAPLAPRGSATRLDWVVGLTAAVVVALVLARRHLQRPSPPLNIDLGRAPAPTFDDGPSPSSR